MNARSQPATAPGPPGTTWMQRVSQWFHWGELPPGHWLRRPERLPEDAYLAQALTLCDLEQRMKRLDRRRAGLFEGGCP